MIRTLDIDDFTNFWYFLNTMKSTFVATVDSIVWSFINVIILTVFALVAVPAALAQSAFLFFWPSTIDSSVSLSTPKFHKELKDLIWEKREVIQSKLGNPNDNHEIRTYDPDLVQYFLHLSAIVYEPWITVKRLMHDWYTEEHINYTRFGHEGCTVMAIWSVEKNFVVLVFKGTSPYNLTEWLTDCTVRKSAAKNNVLPGLVHSGFYDALGFPKKSLLHKLKKKTPLESEETKPAKKHIKLTCDVYFSTKEVKTFYAEDKGAPIGNSTELCGVCEEKFWEKLFLPNLMAIGKHFRHKPNLWITGHSLGAATASVFTSVLLWHKYCNQHDNSNDQNISNDHDNSNDYDLFPQLGLADLLKKLEPRGTYTFGTPRIGDSDFRECIDVARRGYNFWRFINANDIVCSVPVAVSRASNGSYCPQHHYKLFRGTEFTLNDFKHVGDPVILDFRTGKTDQRERGVADVLRGMVSEICSTEEELARGGTFLAKGFVLLNVATLGVFGMLRDHFPSEYYENFKRSLINPVIDVEIEKKNVD